jgi:PHP family Zn ribbon phosphoesterase
MIEGVWVGDGKILVCAGGGGTRNSVRHDEQQVDTRSLQDEDNRERSKIM